LAATVAGVAYFLVPLRSAELVLWPLIAGSSVAAILVGVRLHRPDRAAAWYCLASGVLVLCVGDSLHSYQELVRHVEVPFPSFVDVVYLAMYPLIGAGLVLLVRQRTPVRDRAGIIDPAIVTGGLGLLGWVLLISPYVEQPDVRLVERLTSMAYPLGDVALLALAVRLAVGGGRRPLSFWLLAGSTIPLIGADSLYGFASLAGTWTSRSPVNVGWILFYLGWGAAALHPSMRSLSHRSASDVVVSRRRILVIGSAALIPPVVLLVEELVGSVTDAVAVSLASAALFALVLARATGLAGVVADRRSEARFRSLVDNSLDAIVVVDATGAIRFHTASAERLLHRRGADLEGCRLGGLLERGDAHVLESILSGINAAVSVEWCVRRGDGVLRDLEVDAADLRHDPTVGGVVLTMRDVTDRKRLDGELRRQAFHDGLTDLPNKALFLDRVAHGLRRAERDGGSVGVLFLDLDDFKMVNDSLSHAAGDALLRSVAERLLTAVRPGDTVARFGGDEFAILLEDSDMGVAAVRAAEGVQRALALPFRIGAEEFPVRVSVGVAIGTAGGHTPDELLRDADLAMYEAKRAGKSRSVLFEPTMHEQALRRREITADLRAAIDAGQLVAFYQPVVDVVTAAIKGAEALVRWQHPTKGLIPPNDFIPIAETTGLIGAIGRLMLGLACRQTAEWRRAHLVDDAFYVSVNLSARHLKDPTVVDDVRAALADSGLAASALLLEITESALLDDLDPNVARLQELKDLGVRLAVDDFGTGYSSLSYLSTFPLDIIKIDKSFVDNVAHSREGEAIVRAVVDLSHTLGLSIIAEGVEEADQADALEGLGCEMAQGYLFARPLPSAAMTEKLTGLRAPAVGAGLP
jgi:diguanylate cyclase (GGDEF)-like protein/PAS domain S-box-containing protein